MSKIHEFTNLKITARIRYWNDDTQNKPVVSQHFIISCFGIDGCKGTYHGLLDKKKITPLWIPIDRNIWRNRDTKFGPEIRDAESIIKKVDYH